MIARVWLALIRTAVAAASVGAAHAQAAPWPLPAGAVATDSRTEDPGSAVIADAPWGAGWTPVEAEGRVTLGAWRVPGSTDTTLAMIAPYRPMLAAGGYDVLLDCETEACGGFDFRYALPALPEPGMHVDLGDFRYLSARHGSGPAARYVAILVSRSNDSGFVQILTAEPSDAAPVVLAPPAAPDPDDVADPAPAVAPDAGTGAVVDPDRTIAALETVGHAALDDLAFPSGSADLAPGQYATLEALGRWLAATPEARITLVGHTDAEGSLQTNIAISRQRAQSVADRLVDDYGAPADRIAAEGAGYLAPRASNLTEEGRRKNRRVEVVLTSTRQN